MSNLPTEKYLTRLFSKPNDTIFCHGKFYVPQKGFTRAIELRAGDELYTVNGEYVVIEKIQHEILESPVKVYNFRVADYHTYYVSNNGIATHNNTCTPNTGGTEGGKTDEPGKPSKQYEPTRELKDHLKTGNGNAPKGSKGIDGAHNEAEFLNQIEKHGCKTVGDPVEIEPGIKRYEYQVPAKDKAGNIIEGQYKAKVQTKTTYDPNIISDEAFVNRGVEAFENFKGSLTEGESIPREWSFTDNNGLSWHGYTDGYGNPTSFFPE